MGARIATRAVCVPKFVVDKKKVLSATCPWPYARARAFSQICSASSAYVNDDLSARGLAWVTGVGNAYVSGSLSCQNVKMRIERVGLTLRLSQQFSVVPSLPSCYVYVM